MKRGTWQSKLTKRELKHLREQGITTLRDFVDCRTKQLAMKAIHIAQHPGTNSEPCWDCRMIAEKLGVCQ
jgi:hypothetical protein